MTKEEANIILTSYVRVLQECQYLLKSSPQLWESIGLNRMVDLDLQRDIGKDWRQQVAEAKNIIYNA